MSKSIPVTDGTNVIYTKFLVRTDFKSGQFFTKIPKIFF